MSSPRTAERRHALAGDIRALAVSTGRGVGDETFALDAACETAVEGWLRERAADGPISLLTEDRGWRHLGPDGAGGVRELAGFDHGGPRIALDPVDGTRNVAADLRSAWTVVSACGAGPLEPRFADVSVGVVSETPDDPPARGAPVRRARQPWRARRDLDERRSLGLRRAARARRRRRRRGRRFAPFFRYEPALRPATAALEAAFAAEVERLHGTNPCHLLDDQYIASAGQLVLLTLGTYRQICDPRHVLATRRGSPTVTSKPYDLAGALLVARESGCLVEPLGRDEFDFALDCTTPVGFVGWHNARTRAKLRPALEHALRELSTEHLL
ncbi:MAG: hypothetical protein R3F34_01705 [Planctomycetota bacterium]